MTLSKQRMVRLQNQISIMKFIKKRSGRVWASMISDELDIGLDMVRHVIRELKKMKYIKIETIGKTKLIHLTEKGKHEKFEGYTNKQKGEAVPKGYKTEDYPD